MNYFNLKSLLSLIINVQPVLKLNLKFKLKKMSKVESSDELLLEDTMRPM